MMIKWNIMEYREAKDWEDKNMGNWKKFLQFDLQYEKIKEMSY